MKRDDSRDSKRGKRLRREYEDEDSFSEATVYCNAIKRNSSSSEDDVEMLNIDVHEYVAGHPLPGTSRGRSETPQRTMASNNASRDKQPQRWWEEMTPEDHAAKIIREVEASQARIFQTPGKDMNFLTSQFAHSSLVDESFLLVAVHVDESTKIKIAASEYVNFSKLLP